LSIKDGLAHLSIRPYTDQEWDSLPHVILTSEIEWDPSVLDHDFKEDEKWGEVPEIESSFDEFGDYKHCIIAQNLEYFQRQDGSFLDDVIAQCIFDAQLTEPRQEIVFYDAHEAETTMPNEGSHPEPILIGPKVTSKHEPDYHQLCPSFGWTDTETFKKTLEHTTQYAHLPAGT
jgi:hypothetical protein